MKPSAEAAASAQRVKTDMKRLVLASASPRRREILSHVGLDFDVVVTDADEKNNLPEDVGELVRELAKRKAAACTANGIIIACDTVVCLDGKVLTKPEDADDAARMLRALSANTHQVYSGLCVTDGEKVITSHTVTEVKMRKLTEDEIAAYIATGEPLDKAGAYGIQDLGGIFVERIDGDYYNVVGLPLESLCRILKDSFDYDVLKERA